MKYRLKITPEVVDAGNLIMDETRLVSLRNKEAIPVSLRYQGLVTTGGVFTTPIPLPKSLVAGETTASVVGITTDGPLEISATLQQDWHFDVADQIAARAGYGPMIYNSLIANAYHPEIGRGGYFHPNSGTSEGQGVMILSCLLAYEALRDDLATLDTAKFYQDMAVRMLNAMAEFDGNGPMLRQPIPDNPDTITLLHWLFAAKGPVNLQDVKLDYPVTVSGGSVTVPASALGQGIVSVYKLYPANKQLLFESPFSPVIGGGEIYPTAQVENPNGSLTLTVPAANGAYKLVYSNYSSRTLPLGSAYEAFPVWSAIPDGYAACAPDTFRWFDMALDKAIDLGSPRDAGKWRKLRDALRMTVVKGQNLSDLREVLRPMPRVPVFDTDGMFSYSDNPYAQLPPAGMNQGWLAYNFFSRDPSTGFIVVDVPLASTLPSDPAFSTTQIGRGFDDSWRAANVYQQADQYLLLEMSVTQNQSITTLYTDLQPVFRPFVSTTREFNASTCYYAEPNTADVGGVPLWSDRGLVRTMLFPRSAFKNSGGAVLPVGAQILNFGVEMRAPATVGYTAKIGLMRLVSGPSAEWVRSNLTAAKKGSKLPYFPGSIPFATNANLVAQEFVGYNGNPFHGYQLPDLWLSLAHEAKTVHPALDSNSLPTTLYTTGEVRYPISMSNENGTPKATNIALMEQQLIFLRDAADVWFRDHGFRGPFAHTFVLNTPARYNIGAPQPHTWVYTNDDPNTRWVGYQVRVVESLAHVCFKTVGDDYAADSFKLAKRLLVEWLGWLNTAWPNLSGSPFKGMPTEFEASGAPTTLYEEPHAPAIVLRACLYLKQVDSSHDALCNALIQRCWDYMELNWRTTGEMKHTWSPDPANRQWYGFWHGEILWTLSLMLRDGASVLPAAILPETIIERMVLTSGWLAETGDVDARHRVEVPITGFRAAMLTPHPNWADGYEVSRAYRTDIFTSTDGEEQRRALRVTPRKSIEFGVLADREELRDFQTTMAVWQNRDFTAPELTRYQRITEHAPAGDYFVTLDAIPDWLVVGGFVVLTKRKVAAPLIVDSIIGNRVYFTAPLTVDWTAGSKFCHGVTGHVEADLEVDRLTNSVMTGYLRLNVEPVSEYYPEVFEPPLDGIYPGLTEAPEMVEVMSVPVGSTKLHYHDGDELFLLRNNWAAGMSEGFNWPVNPVDYGTGVMQWDWDIDFTTRLASLTIDCRTPDQIKYLESFFDRMRGAQGNFWMPTWENDLPIVSSIVAESRSITVGATRTAQLLLGNPVYQSIALVTHTGDVFANTILSVDIVDGKAVLGLRDPWPDDISTDEVAMVSWLLVWRLTSDEMIFSWPTDTIARAVIDCQTDKAVRYDPADVENSRRAIIYTSEQYPRFIWPSAKAADKTTSSAEVFGGSIRSVVLTMEPVTGDKTTSSAAVFGGYLGEPLVTLEPVTGDTTTSSASVFGGFIRSVVLEMEPVTGDKTTSSAMVLDGSIKDVVLTLPEITGDTTSSSAMVTGGSLEDV